MKNREKIFSYILLGIFLLSLITDWYRLLVVDCTVTLVVMTLDKMGKGIVLREIMALHACFVCITMPLVGYVYYTREYELSRIWVKYMQVPEEMYFGFAVPAITGFAAAVCWPLMKKKGSRSGTSIECVA